MRMLTSLLIVYIVIPGVARAEPLNAADWQAAYLEFSRSSSTVSSGQTSMEQIPSWPAIDWPTSATASYPGGSVKGPAYFITNLVASTTVTLDTVGLGQDLIRKVLDGGQLGNLAIGLEAHRRLEDAADIVFYSDGVSRATRDAVLSEMDQLLYQERKILADWMKTTGQVKASVAKEVESGTSGAAWRILGELCVGNGTAAERSERLRGISIPSSFLWSAGSTEALVVEVIKRQSDQEIRRCVLKAEEQGVDFSSNGEGQRKINIHEAGIGEDDVPALTSLLADKSDMERVLANRLRMIPPPAVYLKRNGRY